MMDATHFEITQDERNAGTLAPHKLKQIRASFDTNGYAVVSRFISPETCELLLQSVLEDVAQIRARPEPTVHEQRTGPGHLQLGLRRYAPYVKAELVANPLIESIVAALLGAGAWLGFYNGNVNTPGSGAQPSTMTAPMRGNRKRKPALPANRGHRPRLRSLVPSHFSTLPPRLAPQRSIPVHSARPRWPTGRGANGWRITPT
ncbi:MAG: hypothetical protein R3A44_23380 [Caldilineaceae bacterium]